MNQLSNHEQIRQLMYRYAQACDTRDPSALSECFTSDIKIALPGMPDLSEPELGSNIVENLKLRFAKTQHRVFNTLYQIKNDTAKGETYCSALHLLKEMNNGKQEILEWAIRYQDQLALEQGRWKIARRELIIDWTKQSVI